MCGEYSIFAKLESENQGGSVKDRVALAIVEASERSGKLRRGGTIIEATSGNTGIGLAHVAKACGYRALIFMPESMSMERRTLLQSYGAELVLTPAAEGMQGAVQRARAMAKTLPNALLADQFNNPACVSAHYFGTGAELWKDTQGKVDIFVAGVGTGGTLTGVGKFLKEKNPAVQIVAVEPFSSPLLSQGRAGSHAIQGIGANFVPSILDRSLYTEVLTVTDSEAISQTKRLHACGVMVGISSGAALSACLTLASRPENFGKNICTIFPDSASRYTL